MNPASTRPASRGRTGRLALGGVATLAAVALVVLVVSLPRLRDFALRENQEDAARLVARLGEMASRAPSAPADVEDLARSSASFLRQLDDAEFLERGRLLRRHGYLFELVVAEGGARAVRAWPWSHERTGVAAFAWSSAGGLVGHANEGGAWSGPSSPPPVAAPAGSGGWQRLAARR